MTKKHFEQFAQQIKRDLEASGFPNRADTKAEQKATYAADVFAKVAAENNPQFNKERFFTACGLR